MVRRRLYSTSGANGTTRDAPTCRLLDPKGVLNGTATDGGRTTAIAIATTTRFGKVKFALQRRGGASVLEIGGCLEIPDTCGVRPVEAIADVVSAHQQLVLTRLCSTDIGSPTDFFVYSRPRFRNENATVVKLPNVPPEIATSQSLGLVCHWANAKEFVVASLKMLFNQKSGCMEASLDRWWHSNSSSWSSRSGESVTLPNNTRIKNLKKWQTDLVIPYSDSHDRESLLFFVDLRGRGIICCSNLLQQGEAAKLDFIRVPYVKRAPAHQQETFASVGCCNGRLTFVNLDTRNAGKVHVTIRTRINGPHWKETSQFWLYCSGLWEAMKIQNSPALQLPNEPKGLGLCFPVLSTDEDGILYLTMASVDREHAWLLRVNTKFGRLERADEYHSFWDHLKPLHPINCS